MCRADAPVNKAALKLWPNIKRAARSPVFVFCFVDQCTFPHWFWIRCSSCRQPFHLCYKVTGSLLMRATCAGIFSISCGPTVTLWDFSLPLCASSFDAGPLKLARPPKNNSDSWSWNAIHSSGCLRGSRLLISSSRMRSCQYNNHRERKPFLPPTSRINAAHLHTEPTLVRQQLKPRPSGGGVAAREPQIYKLDFYPFTSCSLTSTRQLRRRWLCGLHARCNYNHLCQRYITHDRQELSGNTCDSFANEWAAY